MGSYIKAMGKYATFSGRSTRKEFWGFTIVNWIIWGVLIYLWSKYTKGVATNVIAAAAIMYFLVTIVPSAAVIVRRWHDLGRTGAWLILNLVPVVGYIVTLGFFLRKGDSFTNKYGRDPYAVGARRKRRR